ncbi:TPA: hypothetical protein ACV1G0_000792 [Bacillus cereus]|uniref:hypothetical protein n=1 Tax=unclassified Bacillus cereus group TaxID=2750818 RepID=UPI0022E244F3|nr:MULTISPECIES: hypothetical protein [unclassified Bacillus cereus group]MDA1630414.1 hypothetical protein [Bacillus cereus group sp. TH172LC]MDA1834738.1 hypothetical protein [Bacillus cereus group sp. BY142LC]
MLFVVDDTLEEMAFEERQHFSPLYVCNRANISDLKMVTEHMAKQIGYKLKMYYEIECPEGDSDFAVDSLSDLDIEERVCEFCGTAYIPDLDRVWVVFDFLPEYIEYIKKKEKTNVSNDAEISNNSLRVSVKDLFAMGFKIENLNIGIGGNVTMDNRRMGNVIGNNFGDNINLQGDNVVQTKVMNEGEFEEVYKDLMKEIHGLQDEFQKEQALFIAEQMKTALNENDVERAGRPLNLLRKVLGDVASIASIASIFGITLG